MSEETSQEVQKDEVPQDVKELQEVLGDFAAYRNAINKATFSGETLEASSKLQKFIRDSYNSFLEKFNNHPYVIKVRKEQEEMVKTANKRMS